MKQRHEWKIEISYADLLSLRSRLSAVMKVDPHAQNGKYTIKSLYFDNMRDKALLEKINGVNEREKFRLRLYNDDSSVIFLEKKSKKNELCTKLQAPITAEQTKRLIGGDTDFLRTSPQPLLNELGLKMKTQGLKPKALVRYTREPFVYPAGNVRVTMDYNIRTGLSGVDFLNPDCVMIPAGEPTIILEVKWDEFLPSVIRDAVQIPSSRAAAFSKYAACRLYG